MSSTCLYVFDFYDTLIEERIGFPSTATIAETLESELGLTTTDAARLATAVVGYFVRVLGDPGFPVEPTLKGLCVVAQRAGISLEEEIAARVLWRLLGAGDNRFAVKAGGYELLEAITRRGHEVRLLSNCILTESQMDGILARLDLLKFISQRVYSSAGRVKKPNASAFEAVGRGDFRHRYMIGDSLIDDIAPARELGWRTLKVGSALPSVDMLED